MVLQRRDSTLLEGGSSTCPGKCGRDEIRRAELVRLAPDAGLLLSG